MPNEKTVISSCCNAEIHLVPCPYNPRTVKLNKCNKCDHLCEATEVCAYCLGTGEVEEDETDSDGNIARGTLTKKCICTLKTNEEYEHE